MSSWYIVLVDHKLETFNRKEPIKRGHLLLCKPAKKSKDKLSTKIGYYNYVFSEDIVFKLTDDDFQWLLPIPFESTRYEMLTEKRKVWDQRHKIKRGTLLRVYIQKLERVFYASVREMVEPEKRGKMIQVKLGLHGDDNVYHISIGEVIEICEEHESSGNDKRFRINDRVVSSFNGKHGYIEAFVDGEASQGSAKVIYDDQPSEIVLLEFLISEHDYDCGRQAEHDLNQAAATIGKRRTCINVGNHRRQIIHHWWDLIRSPKTLDALKLFLEQFNCLIIEDTLKRKCQVGNERTRAFLVVLLGLTDNNYRSVLEYYEKSAFDVFRHLSSFDEESPLNLQSSRENYRMAQQFGVISLCRNLQKTFDSKLNVDDIADKMIQSEHLPMEQAKDYLNMNLLKDRINFLLTHIEASIPSTLAVFLQILETDYRQLYDKIKEASDKEGHAWRAVLKADKKNIVDKIYLKIRTILFALSDQDIITKEELDRITGHHLCQEMSSCFIDVLIDKQFPVPSNVFEILKREGFCELAKKLHKDQREYKEDEKGRVNSNWQNILETERQEIASNLTNTEKICELLQKSGILKKEQRKFIQDVSSAEQQGHYLIDEIKLMAYDGRKAFLEALQRTGNEHVYNHLTRQEKIFENMPKQISSSAPGESCTRWNKLLDDTTIWISETMNETQKVLAFLYRKGIITYNRLKEIEKYPKKQQVFDIIDEVKSMALKGREEFLSALEATGNSEIYGLLTKLGKLKNEEYSQEISVMTNKAVETTCQRETSMYKPWCILGRLWSGSSQATGGTLVSEDDRSSTEPPACANVMEWEESTDLKEALKRSKESYEKDKHMRQRRNEQLIRAEIEKTSESMKIKYSETRYEQPKSVPKAEASPSIADHEDLLKREIKQRTLPSRDVTISANLDCSESIANIEYPKGVPDHLAPGNLVRGSKVKIQFKESAEYGSIRWIGYLKAGKGLFAGLEMEHDVGYTDGMFKEKRLFESSSTRGIITKYEHCEADGRDPSETTKTAIATSAPFRELLDEFSNMLNCEGFAAETVKTLKQHGFDSYEKLDLLYGKPPEIEKLGLLLAHKLQLEAYLEKRCRQSLECKLLAEQDPSESDTCNDADVGQVFIEDTNTKVTSYTDEQHQYQKHSEHEATGFQRSFDLAHDICETTEIFHSQSPQEALSSPEMTCSKMLASNIAIGDRVKVLGFKDAIGKVKWIGRLTKSYNVIAGLEMESDIENGNNGVFKGRQIFDCKQGRGKFIPLQRCMKIASEYPSNTPAENVAVGCPVSLKTENFPKGFALGNVVEMTHKGKTCRGNLQWVGYMKNPTKLIAGIEVKEDIEGGSDGKLKGCQLFNCPINRGIFISLANCRKVKE